MLLILARFDILTQALIKIQVFWDITLCWLVHSFWHFKDTKCLHLCNPANQEEIFTKQLLDPEDGGSKLLQNISHYLPNDKAS